MILFTTDIRIANTTAHQKPLISKPLTSLSTSMIISTVMIKLTRPSVSQLKGKARILRIQPNVALITPISIATHIAVPKLFTDTPGNIAETSQTANESTKRCMMNCMIIIVLSG